MGIRLDWCRPVGMAWGKGGPPLRQAGEVLQAWGLFSPPQHASWFEPGYTCQGRGLGRDVFLASFSPNRYSLPSTLFPATRTPPRYHLIPSLTHLRFFSSVRMWRCPGLWATNVRRDVAAFEEPGSLSEPWWL